MHSGFVRVITFEISSLFVAATILPLGSEVVFTSLLYLDYSPIPLTIIASIGNTFGGLLTYYMGWLGKWEWLQRWAKIDQQQVVKHLEKAQNYGWFLAFMTWAPIIGDVLAVVVGFVKYPWPKTVFWMFFGKLLRFSILAFLWQKQTLF